MCACTKVDGTTTWGGRRKRNTRAGIQYVEETRRCGNFNLQKEGGNKVETEKKIHNITATMGAKKVQRKERKNEVGGPGMQFI